MAKVLLLNMPFTSLERPAIGISILKARLAANGHECTTSYGNLFFAERIGIWSYTVILDRISSAMFAGDWLFSQWLFPDRDQSDYLATLRQQLGGDTPEYGAMLEAIPKIAPFLDACFERFHLTDYDIVGFTTTFEQNLASLALARLIKTRYPEKIIVFGGANCEGVMGLELHRQFPWIDFVCSGEADRSFPILVGCLESGQVPDDIPGVIYRQGGETLLAAPQDRVHDMDSLPDPDFDDYFRELGQSTLVQQVRPVLMIETARGCWWGAKSHCTFCGLNGTTMTFRAKSAERVYDELCRQHARYRVGHFLAVDNIMSYQYFRDLLPMLKRRNPGVTLFYEIKSNLKRDQVELLRDAGVLALQPGIESLNSHVLQIMRKGVTAIQNVQLLRFCREYGIEIAWNLLYGFPGENDSDYADTARVMQSIFHLKPPGAVAAIRLDRFSPNFDQAEHFGLVEVSPFSMYRFLYPLPEEAVAKLAYFFEYVYRDGRKPERYMKETLERVNEWKMKHSGDLIKRYSGGDLILADTRGKQEQYFLSGIEKEIYELCDEIQSRSAILELAIRGGIDSATVDLFLEQLVRNRLMMREGNQYLALAVNMERRLAAQWAA